MDLVKVMETFPTQTDCIEYLERLRWAGSPECPHCEGLRVKKRKETALGRIGRWNCHDCRSTFKVTQGTMFQGTKLPLQKWFIAISLMANAKKSLSSHQLARDLGLNQKATWSMMKIRAEMAKENVLLQGVVEADETYIGGKHRKDYDRAAGEPRKRGRGTAKDAVLGAVQRDGQVVAQLVPDVTGQTILEFIKKFVKTEESELITDQYSGYNKRGNRNETGDAQSERNVGTR